jgi:hypothetical protein
VSDKIDKLIRSVVSADLVQLMSIWREIGGVSYEFCNKLLLGLATIRAHQLDAALVSLAVWDDLTGDGPGDAASPIQDWRKAGCRPEIIDLAKIRQAGAVQRTARWRLIGSTTSRLLPGNRILVHTLSRFFLPMPSASAN